MYGGNGMDMGDGMRRRRAVRWFSLVQKKIVMMSDFCFFEDEMTWSSLISIAVELPHLHFMQRKESESNTKSSKKSKEDAQHGRCFGNVVRTSVGSAHVRIRLGDVTDPPIGVVCL
mmetsp:Transcript_16444/g.18860  ORF Transcript_16444/g.18860 Transcript_16444/m.18860 type:complete len:116 (+) Transcript_16444:25-372(+)